jgi:ketosteroid isomerase-like protein
MIVILLFAALLQADVEANRAAAEKFFKAFNARDFVTMEALYAPDAVLTSSDFCAPRGRADLRRTYETLFDGHPDVVDIVDVMVAEQDYVAVRFHAVADSGRNPMRLPLMAMLRFRDGLIVEDDTIFDTGGKPCDR